MGLQHTLCLLPIKLAWLLALWSISLCYLFAVPPLRLHLHILLDWHFCLGVFIEKRKNNNKSLYSSPLEKCLFKYSPVCLIQPFFHILAWKRQKKTFVCFFFKSLTWITLAQAQKKRKQGWAKTKEATTTKTGTGCFLIVTNVSNLIRISC